MSGEPVEGVLLDEAFLRAKLKYERTGSLKNVEDGWTALMGENVRDFQAVDAFWDLVEKEGPHHFFNDIAFANNGGFSDVKNLTDPESDGGMGYVSRTFWAALSMIFAVYNTYFIISSDIFRTDEQIADETDDDGKPYYLMCRTLFTPIISWFMSNVLEPMGYDLTKNSNWKGGAMLFIHYAEFGFLVILYFRLIRNVMLAMHKSRMVCRWCRPPDARPKEQFRWIALSHIFWRNIPEIGIISGMRVLGVFQGTQLAFEIGLVKEGVYPKWGCLGLIFKLIVCFIFGIDCFLVKFRAVSSTIMPEHSDKVDLNSFLVPLMFARQMCSLVDIPNLINERLFVFIFGGEDSVMQQHERAKRECWNAMMVKAFWQDCFTGDKLRGSLKFGVLMLSWSDFDFQKLVLDPKHVKTEDSCCRNLGLCADDHDHGHHGHGDHRRGRGHGHH